MAETLDAGALDRLAALEREATPGTWWQESRIIHAPLPGAGASHPVRTEYDEDADLIVALRNAAPALIALARAGLAAEREVARLSGILATLERAVEDALEAAAFAQKRRRADGR